LALIFYFALISFDLPDTLANIDFSNLKLTSAAEQIIDNVQVVVENVHIQYMDKKTDPEVFFCDPSLVYTFKLVLML